MEEGAIVEEGEAGERLQQQHQLKVEKSAYEQLQQTRSSIEEIVAHMLSMKKKKQPNTNTNTSLPDLVTQMFIHFVVLRQTNRSILLEEDRIKAETERAKAPVDFTTLQLHNLMYEKNHYVKAIKACRDFRSKYPDIELVPEEEYFRDAPEDIKGTGTTMSNDCAHKLMLKRLNYELFQRKELCKHHEKLEQRKKSLLETIANRKKFLSSLPSHLKSLKKASLPVQNQLGVLHTKKLKQHQLAELLPPPLYVVYSQLMAQKEAFGEGIDLEIAGSVKEAQAFARQQSVKDTGVPTNTETSKVEDDAPDDDDDGQRRRKRPKKVPSKENPEQGGGIYHSHPLKIVLHIYDDEILDPTSLKLITLKFEYLFKFNVVCVGTEGSRGGPESNILCNLFPDDTGLELPHQSAKVLVGNELVFDEKKASRPYKWAQHLAGIDFLPEVSPVLTGRETPSSEASKSAAVISGLSLYRQQNRVETVVQRIRSRQKSQLALAEQLDILMMLRWPSLTCESVPWASHNPFCHLDEWSPVGSSLNQVLPLPVTDTEQVQDPLGVDVDGRVGASKEESESAREDGELPSLVPAAAVVNDALLSPSKGSNIEHSRQLALISKSMTPQISKAKSLSFRKHDEELEIMLDVESDLDEPAPIEGEGETAAAACYECVENSWVDYGVREFCLLLSRKMDDRERNVKLNAKIKISMEYPLRPPLFTVSLGTASHGESYSDVDDSNFYNELRAMEAEVNLHILKRVPEDQENYILAHQVRCLAMLFDFYMDDLSSFSESRKHSSVVDVGLCKPVSGMLLARSFRGRDHRKMLSWKDVKCTPGYPY